MSLDGVLIVAAGVAVIALIVWYETRRQVRRRRVHSELHRWLADEDEQARIDSMRKGRR